MQSEHQPRVARWKLCAHRFSPIDFIFLNVILVCVLVCVEAFFPLLSVTDECTGETRRADACLTKRSG